MARHTRSLVPIALLFCGFLTKAGAQSEAGLPKLDLPPSLLRIHPAAIATGSRVVLELTGAGMETAVDLLASRPGLVFRILPQDPLPAPAKAGARPMPRPANMPSRLACRVEVTVPATLGSGWLDLRVITPGGVSNPRHLLVTDQAVLLEKEPNSEPETAQELAPGQVASGIINATTDVDYYRFQGKKGQRILAWLATTSLDSRLPGAVEIIGPDERVLAQARDSVDADALLDLTLPTDGSYRARVFSFGHVEGNADCFYLFRVGAEPVVEAVHPLVVSAAGGECLVFGHALPGGTAIPGRTDGLEQARLQLDPAQEKESNGNILAGLLPLKPFRWRGAPGPVIRLPVADGPVLVEEGDNNTSDKATTLTLPALVAGRLEKPGDRDWYSFEAKKGEPVWIELLGDRLGTRLDFLLAVRAGNDTNTMEVDDGPEPLHPQWFFNRSGDPAVKFLPSRDGIHRLMISARDGDLNGAAHQVYALRVGPARPDFRLVTIAPASQGGSPRLKPGTSLAFLVLAQRSGGMEEPVSIQVGGLPAGVKALPCQIPSGQKGAWLTLLGGPDLPDGVWPLQITGTSGTADTAIKREARHAGPAWPVTQQVSNPQASRMEQGLYLATAKSAPVLTTAPEKPRVIINQGERQTVQFRLTKPGSMKSQVQVALVQPQAEQDGPVRVANGNNGQIMVAADKNQAEFQLEVRNNARAQIVQLVPRCTITTQEDDPDNPGRKRQVIRVEGGTPLEVVILPKRPLQVTVPNQTVRGKAGQTAPLVVRLERQGFYGPVRLICTEYGIDTTVPADQKEAALPLKLPADIRPGGRQLKLKATCEALPGHSVEQEATVSFNFTPQKP